MCQKGWTNNTVYFPILLPNSWLYFFVEIPMVILLVPEGTVGPARKAYTLSLLGTVPTLAWSLSATLEAVPHVGLEVKNN